MMIAAIIGRVEVKVSELTGRVQGAADLAGLMQNNRLPQKTPAAHVIPLGLRGGATNAAAGAFIQELTSMVGVLLTLRSHDATGARALGRVDQLISDVIAALAGWTPDGETGVLRLDRGHLVSMSAGTFVYQIEFSITDQLRIFA